MGGRLNLVTYSLRLEETLGIPPLVRCNGKQPQGMGWPTGPREHPAEWRNKLRDYVGNVGLVTGYGLVVIDVDLYVEGALDSWDALVDRGFTPYTVTGLTGGGGRHYLYRVPEGLKVLSHSLPDFPGIDVKAHNGFIVIPPSIHVDTGQEYEWEHGWGPFDVEMVELSPAQVEFLGIGNPGSNRGLGRVLDSNDYRTAKILCDHGGHSMRVRGERIEITRPGKERGSSVEIGFGNSGGARFWTPNWPPFEDRWYDGWEIRKIFGIPDHNIRIKPAPEPALPTLRAFLAVTAPDYDWLIPDLLERGDRLVLTGAEGYGKSTLLRQLGIGAALGVNPLARGIVNHHEPCNVLLVDLENSPNQLRRRFAEQLAVTDERSDKVLDRFFLEVHSQGLALDSRRDADHDRAWLVDLIERCQPDLLIMGPIYKMILGNPWEEEASRDMAKWLDLLRVTYGLTVALEAHSPHDQIRPYGWSGWKRWPEFGIHLNAEGTLKHWRGDREERHWPTHLQRGGKGGWLWIPAIGDEEEEPALDRTEERIVGCKADVLRCLRSLDEPAASNEIVDWLGKRKPDVLAAIARLKAQGFIIVTPGERIRDNGKSYPVELLSLNPDHTQ